MAERDQCVESLLSLERRHERDELLRRALVLGQLDEGSRALQPQLRARRLVRSEIDGRRVQVDDRALRPAAARCVRCSEEVRDRPRRLAGFAPVVRKNRRERRRCAPERLFDVPGDSGVALPTHRPRHRRVRDFADQHVLERVLDVACELARRIAPNEVA